MTDPTPNTIAEAINLKQKLEADAKIAESWFARYPRLTFLILGMVVGQVLAWWFGV